jgi:hypothetical protein
MNRLPMLRAVARSPSTDRPRKRALIRLQATAIVICIGAAGATYLLVTGWTSNACGASATGQSSPSCAAVTWGLIAAAILGTALAGYFGFKDRKEVMTAALDPIQVVASGARGARWSTVFAIGLSVLLFADCSGSIVSGTGGAMADPAGFWSLAPWLIVPFSVALAVPAALAAIAQRQLARQSPSSARTALLAAWSIALVVLVGVAAAVAGLVIGIPTCYIFSSSPSSMSPSVCAAGVGSIANILSSFASAALFLPYLLMINSAIGRSRAELVVHLPPTT